MRMTTLAILLAIACILLIQSLFNVEAFSICKTRFIRSVRIDALPSVPSSSSSQKFSLGGIAFSLLPLSPESMGRRKTLIKEVVPGQIWTLDQIQGIINVNVPVRSTIIKLSQGGLFVHNPVAPTAECLQMVRTLENQHGPVRHIVLSSVALEHKGTAGAFSRYFPKAEIFAAPGQYSFPIDLPLSFFFPLGRKIHTLPADSSSSTPWYPDIQHTLLGPLLSKGAGGFTDAAFYHSSTRTLLVTDAVVKVEDQPPEIIDEDPRALLYHARDSVDDSIDDTEENRRKGWRRMVLFALTFQPSGIRVLDLSESLKKARNLPAAVRQLGRGAVPLDEGLYPWDWVESELPNFRALQGGLLVAPILQKLILNRAPKVVADWVERVCQWPFQRIIPCHLANDIKAGPDDFRAAFDFLYEPPSSNNIFGIFGKVKRRGARPLDADVKLLTDASKSLTEQDVVFPEGPLLKR